MSTVLQHDRVAPVDRYGRRIDYLRVSVTDRCNLRCVYCMPIEDLVFTPGAQMLTASEIETVVGSAAEVGFRKVRLTGGEPTLRADIVDIVRRIASIEGIHDVAMTTNGILLPRMIDDLVAAGLDRVNLHIDSLDPQRVSRVMRFASIDAILAGVAAVERAGLQPIKVNCVVVRGYNDRDVVDLARHAIENGWRLRFVELMPLGGGVCADLSHDRFVSTRQTQDRIEAALGRLAPLPPAYPSDEARDYRVGDTGGVIGFISPVSDPYCGTCNRMRVTADGRFHLCLLNDDELDVRAVLRSGGGRAAVRAVLLRAIAQKPTGHRLDRGVSTKHRSMFQIGG